MRLIGKRILALFVAVAPNNQHRRSGLSDGMMMSVEKGIFFLCFLMPCKVSEVVRYPQAGPLQSKGMRKEHQELLYFTPCEKSYTRGIQQMLNENMLFPEKQAEKHMAGSS